MTGEVYVVVTFDHISEVTGKGRVVDLEVLDSMPKWNWEAHSQQVFVANVNGGDSLPVEMPERNKRHA